MNLHEGEDESIVAVAGMVVSLKLITTKQGKSMAFMELEDQIERCEVVLFPEVWRKSSTLVDKGLLLSVRGKLQKEDEGFKLLAEEVVTLSEESARELATRARQRMHIAKNKATAQTKQTNKSSSTSTAKSYTKSTTSAKSVAPTEQEMVPSSSASGVASVVNDAPHTDSHPEPVLKQRVFIKITKEAQQADKLAVLKKLLASHPGPVGTLLFYEETQKLFDLSETYSIKPSPELFQEMEQMLGEGTVKVK